MAQLTTLVQSIDSISNIEAEHQSLVDRDRNLLAEEVEKRAIFRMFQSETRPDLIFHTKIKSDSKQSDDIWMVPEYRMFERYYLTGRYFECFVGRKIEESFECNTLLLDLFAR